MQQQRVSMCHGAWPDFAQPPFCVAQKAALQLGCWFYKPHEGSCKCLAGTAAHAGATPVSCITHTTSLGFSRRFTAANLRVFFCLPMFA